MAVADLAGDDLRLLDAVDRAAVIAPALISSLAIPTAPRPALLAATGLGDLDASLNPVQQADLLAVAATGLAECQPFLHPGRLAGCVQVVDTWSTETTVVSSLTIDLLDVPGGADAQILSLALMPVTAADGTRVAGQARLVAGLSGGRLLVADYVRAADGQAIARADLAASDPSQAPRVLDGLGFDPVALSPSPDQRHLYAASTDVIPGTVNGGVAELDLTGPPALLPQTPALRALDAGAPTTHVLATRVRRFKAFSVPYDPNLDVYGDEELLVYAARTAGSGGADDPDRCGAAEAVECGIVAIDPVAGGAAGTGGLAREPGGAFRAPFRVPARVLGLVEVTTPEKGGFCLPSGAKPPCVAPETLALQPLFLSSGVRKVSTLAAAASSDGRVYLLDLGHDNLANTQDWLATGTASTGAKVSSGVFSTLLATSPKDTPLLAMMDPRPSVPVPTRDSATVPALVRMTPGFTPSDIWSLKWQGQLPGLASLRGQAEVANDGTVTRIGLQEATGLPGPYSAANPRFRAVGRLYDPRLAIQVGDIVQVTAVRGPGDGPRPIDTSVDGSTISATDLRPDTVLANKTADQYCPFGFFEAKVTALEPPSDDFPGGAVAVTDAVTQPANPFGVQTNGDTRLVQADPRCMVRAAEFLPAPSQAPNVLKDVKVTFRAKELLLTGAFFGYAGRPQQGTEYVLRHTDPAADEALCPMLGTTDFADPATGLWHPPACDDTCRAACEELLLSRKSRRQGYVYAQCPSGDTACIERWNGTSTVNVLDFSDPLALTGPVLDFTVVWTDAQGQVVVVTPATTPQPERDASLTVSTSGGQASFSRNPLQSGRALGNLLPAGLATFDRGAAVGGTSTEGMRVFVAYPDNLVLEFAPDLDVTGEVVLR
jgi:hypothetical protein